ncbi:Uncharacterised protein [Yersinia bercovieri]|nr:Uncharacterised protein [Yersinia bercovieri]CNE87757.1 Uncharacterised protein [Yersinia bercovieri]CNH91670.1 Uncharacterised protein [Yersinia bercovieri]
MRSIYVLSLECVNQIIKKGYATLSDVTPL